MTVELAPGQGHVDGWQVLAGRLADVQAEIRRLGAVARGLAQEMWRLTPAEPGPLPIPAYVNADPVYQARLDAAEYALTRLDPRG